MPTVDDHAWIASMHRNWHHPIVSAHTNFIHQDADEKSADANDCDFVYPGHYLFVPFNITSILVFPPLCETPYTVTSAIAFSTAVMGSITIGIVAPSQPAMTKPIILWVFSETTAEPLAPCEPNSSTR